MQTGHGPEVAGHQGSAGAEPGAFDLWQLLAGIWRRKRMVLGITFVVTAIAFVAVSMVASRYEADARILIQSRETAFTVAEGQVVPSPADPLSVKSEAEVLMSRDLAVKIIEVLKLENNREFVGSGKVGLIKRLLILIGMSEDPAKLSLRERALLAYYGNLTIEPVTGSRVINIGFMSGNPNIAADIPNKVAEEYINITQSAQMENTRLAVKWLSDQISALRQTVIRSEEAVERFRTNAGLIKGPSTTLNSQQLSELNSQIILAAAARSEAQARASSIRAILRKGSVDSAPDVLNSQLIQRLVEQKVTLKRQIADLQTTFLPSHPRMIRLNAEITGLDKQIHAEARKVVTSLENQAGVAGAREASLRASLEKLKSRATDNNQEDVQLRALDREAKANRELLESLLKRYRAATSRDNLTAQPPAARIISHASPPDLPGWPKRGAIVLIAMTGSLILGLLAAFLQEALAMSAYSQMPPRPRETARVAETSASARGPGQPLPAYEHLMENNRKAASAPAVRQSVAPFSLAIEDGSPTPGPLSDFGDAVLARHRDDGVRRVVVTGAGKTEDRALVVAALGRYLALSDIDTVIVDTDHTGSGLESECAGGQDGFGDLLLGRAAFADIVMEDADTGVDFIHAGTAMGDAIGLLGDRRFDVVLETLDTAYDLILINAAEAGIAREVDMVLDRGQLVLAIGPDTAAGHDWLSSFATQLSATSKAGLMLVTVKPSRPRRQTTLRRAKGLENA